MNSDILKPNLLQRTVILRGQFSIIVPNDYTLASLLVPGNWANHANVIKPGDIIEACRADFTLDVLLRAVEVKPGMVKVRVLAKYMHDDSSLEASAEARSIAANAGVRGAGEVEADVPEGYKVGFIPKGENSGYWVQLKATGAFLRRGIATRGAAIQFALAHKTEADTPLKQAS